jgi:hypothetical protein
MGSRMGVGICSNHLCKSIACKGVEGFRRKHSVTKLLRVVAVVAFEKVV